MFSSRTIHVFQADEERFHAQLFPPFPHFLESLSTHARCRNTISSAMSDRARSNRYKRSSPEKEDRTFANLAVRHPHKSGTRESPFSIL
jgi:hypothetical protein